jgi:hypothetical protein
MNSGALALFFLKEFELYELSGNRGKKIRAGFRRE